MVGAHALPFTAHGDAAICTPFSFTPGLLLASSMITPSSVQSTMFSEENAWNTVPLHDGYPSVVGKIQNLPSK